VGQAVDELEVEPRAERALLEAEDADDPVDVDRKDGPAQSWLRPEAMGAWLARTQEVR
jgi:hypothetical protein